MKTNNRLTLSTSPLAQPVSSPRKTAGLTRRQRLLYGRKRHHPTGKERDMETGLYYYGARYLDSRTSRWLSGDPAVGEYVPEAPVNDEARKRNGNLPGQGGVFNYVNLHVYHYAGNNPVKYTDPDGEVTVLIGAIIGGVVGGAVGGLSTAASGGSWQDVVSSTVTGTASGAVMGAIAGTGIGLFGLVVTGGVTSAASSVANEIMSAGLEKGMEGIKELDPAKVAINATVDGIIGAAFTGLSSKIPTEKLAKPLIRVAVRGAYSKSETASIEALYTAVKGARNTAITATSILLEGTMEIATTVIQDQVKKFVGQEWQK